MITYFYKILYDNKKVVYVGVTTRTINKRFREHIISKKMNNKFSVIEFDKIIHPEISSIDIFKEEYKKVSELEKRYIKEELGKGNILLNITPGGEWGASIYHKLLKEDFFKKYGNYDNFEIYIKKKHKTYLWLRNWIYCKTINKTKAWLNHWINNISKNKTKGLLNNWISHRSENKTKRWLRHWINIKLENKTKVWLKSWISHRSENKTKRWLRSWISHRSENKTKRWLNNWIYGKSTNKTKIWLRHWILNVK